MMTIEQATSEMLALKEGEAQVINGRAVCRERGGFYIEGTKNRFWAWNTGAAWLAKHPRRAG